LNQFQSQIATSNAIAIATTPSAVNQGCRRSPPTASRRRSPAAGWVVGAGAVLDAARRGAAEVGRAGALREDRVAAVADAQVERCARVHRRRAAGDTGQADGRVAGDFGAIAAVLLADEDGVAFARVARRRRVARYADVRVRGAAGDGRGGRGRGIAVGRGTVAVVQLQADTVALQGDGVADVDVAAALRRGFGARQDQAAAVGPLQGRVAVAEAGLQAGAVGAGVGGAGRTVGGRRSGDRGSRWARGAVRAGGRRGRARGRFGLRHSIGVGRALAGGQARQASGEREAAGRSEHGRLHGRCDATNARRHGVGIR
jgi:hypothetical protein